MTCFDWKVEKDCKFASMQGDVPWPCQHAWPRHCSLSAVQRKTAFLEQFMMAWIWHVCINAMSDVSWHKLFHTGWTQKNCPYKVYSLNLIDEFTPLFSPKLIFAGLPRESLPTEACLCRHQCFSVVAQATAKIHPRPAQGLFSNEKELHRTTEAIVLNEYDEWKVEKAECQHAANMCHSVPTWAKIAVCQLCRERQPFWNSHDGLNLTCLDQCHGVVSHGTSYSQGWRQRLVIQQSKFDPWVDILVFRRRWLLQVCLGKAFPHAFVDISVFLWLRSNGIRPRPAQGLFSNERTS